MRGDDGPGGAVDKRWSDKRIELGVRGRVSCHRRCAAKDEGGFIAQLAAVDPEFDVWVEHCDEGVEVAIARGGEESVDDVSLSMRGGRVRLSRVVGA